MKPWLKRSWSLPGKPDAKFICAMEDVLEVYTRPYNPKRPQVCMDERSTQLIGDVRAPIPPKPGQPMRIDYHYRRNGTANLFLMTEPLTGKTHVKVTERRTMVDWAQFMREMVEVHYPEAEQIVLVLDNLNTHGKHSLYEAFPPEEAKRIADRLEMHPTPKHASWLNIAEIELSALSRQCLDRRIPDRESLRREVTAWTEQRNQNRAPVDWRFTTEDARIKLKRLYPAVQ